MPFVLCVGEAWSFKLREEHRRSFREQGVEETFSPKWQYLTRDWRKPHTEDLHDVYCLPNIYLGYQIKDNEMGGVCLE
jgi:hypothetical protein